MIHAAKRQYAKIKGPCPICGKKGWCTRSTDGERIHCMRTASARACEKGGWIHALNGAAILPPVKAEPVIKLPSRQLEQFARQAESNLSPAKLVSIASSLGLSTKSLKALRIGWADSRSIQQHNTKCKFSGCYTFPMLTPHEAICGIRLRAPDGFKYAIKGGGDGLFIPNRLSGAGPLAMVEGPTSTAAMLDLGFDCIGRPSCNSGNDQVRQFLKLIGKCDVVILGDRDEKKVRPDGSKFYPGQDGAMKLAKDIAGLCTVKRVYFPPSEELKDARAMLNAGFTRDAMLKELGLRN